MCRLPLRKKKKKKEGFVAAKSSSLWKLTELVSTICPIPGEVSGVAEQLVHRYVLALESPATPLLVLSAACIMWITNGSLHLQDKLSQPINWAAVSGNIPYHFLLADNPHEASSWLVQNLLRSTQISVGKDGEIRLWRSFDPIITQIFWPVELTHPRAIGGFLWSTSTSCCFLELISFPDFCTHSKFDGLPPPESATTSLIGSLIMTSDFTCTRHGSVDLIFSARLLKLSSDRELHQLQPRQWFEQEAIWLRSSNNEFSKTAA